MRKLGLLVVAMLMLAITVVFVSAQEADFVNVRVAHLSPDTPNVDVWVDGEVALSDLAYGTVSEWVTIPAGPHDLAVGSTGLFIEAAFISADAVELPAGEFVTIAAIGSRLGLTLGPAILVEDFSELDEDEARVGVFHAIEGALPVDVVAGDTALIEFLAYPGTQGSNDGFFEADVPAGTYDVAVEQSLFLRGESTAEAPAAGATPEPRPDVPVVLSLEDVTLEAGAYYFVAAAGTADDAQLVVAVTSAEDAAALRAGEAPAGAAEEPAATPEPTAEATPGS